jgi:galactofuranose transport system permease protein
MSATATPSAPTAPAATRPSEARRVVGWLQRYGVYVAIAVVLVVNAVITTNFLSASNARVQLFQVTPILLVSLGMALVIGTEGIDLSVGAVMALAAALVPLYLGYGPWIAALVALVAGAISGLVAGGMVAIAGVQPIVATLALMIGVRGLAVIFNGAQAKSVSDPTIGALGIDQFLGVPVMAWLALLFVLLVAFLVQRTTFGRQLLAVGDNRAASRLAGVPVRRILLLVYVMSGVLAALAGVVAVGHAAEADPAQQGLNIELSAITAVVVGGTPLSGGQVRVVGTVAGAVFMQLVNATLIQHNIPASYAQIVEAVIICLAVYAAKERSSR